MIENTALAMGMRGPATGSICFATLFAVVATVSPAIAGRDGGTFDSASSAYLNRDFATSLKIVRSLAAKGDARAQYYLGRHYQFGEAVAKDYAEAYFWYRRAEAAGHIEAKFFRVMLENYWKMSTADKARAERKLALLKPGNPGRDGPPVAAANDKQPIDGVKSRPTFRSIELTGVIKDNGPPRNYEATPPADAKTIAAARTGEMSRLEVKPRPPISGKTDERPAISARKPLSFANLPEKPRNDANATSNATRESAVTRASTTPPVDDAENQPPRFVDPRLNLPSRAYAPPPRSDYEYPPYLYRSYMPRPAYAPPPTYYPTYYPNGFSPNRFWHPGWRRVPPGYSMYDSNN